MSGLFLFPKFGVMRLLILLLALSIFGQKSIAQTDFCMPGSRWIYYSTGSASPPSQSHIVYEGDTLIDGLDAKVLRTEFRWGPDELWAYDVSRSFFRRSNDSILQFIDGSFELMFDFDVQAGDTRSVYIGGGLCTMQDTMLIDSIGTMNYQGQELNVYHFNLLIEDQLSLLDGAIDGYFTGGGQGMYVERIGLMADHPTNLLVNCVDGNIIVEYVPANFVCYTDNELAVNYPDTCNLFLGLDNEIEEYRAELFCSNQTLNVLNAPNSTLHIYNILGVELLQERINSDNQSFDISNLPSGILMVVVETDTGRLTKKVIKSTN